MMMMLFTRKVCVPYNIAYIRRVFRNANAIGFFVSYFIYFFFFFVLMTKRTCNNRNNNNTVSCSGRTDIVRVLAVCYTHLETR